MNNEKKYAYLALSFELAYTVFWLVELLSIICFNKTIHNLFGSQINIWFAFNVLAYDNYFALKLSLYFLILLCIGLFVPSWCKRTVYTNYQNFLAIVCLILNTILIIILLVALANPILIAFTIVSFIGALSMATS